MKRPQLKLIIEYGEERVEKVIPLRGPGLYTCDWRPYGGIPAEDELASIIRDEVLRDLNDGKEWFDTDGTFSGMFRFCRELVERIKERSKSL